MKETGTDYRLIQYPIPPAVRFAGGIGYWIPPAVRFAGLVKDMIESGSGLDGLATVSGKAVALETAEKN